MMVPEKTKGIPLEECKPRHVYRLQCRNLKIGVFNPETKGFIGIRTKFSNRYLFTEYHWDTGPPHGTAHPMEDLGLLDDDNIFLLELYPTTCNYCGERITYKKDPVYDKTYKSKWLGCNPECSNSCPVGRNYTPLFKLLEKLEKNLKGKCPLHGCTTCDTCGWFEGQPENRDKI